MCTSSLGLVSFEAFSPFFRIGNGKEHRFYFTLLNSQEEHMEAVLSHQC